MIGRVPSGIGEVENPVGAGRAKRRRGNIGISYRKSINIFTCSRFFSYWRAHIEVYGTHQMMPSHKHVSNAQREAFHKFAVNLQAGLLGIGWKQVSVYSGPALHKE